MQTLELYNQTVNKQVCDDYKVWQISMMTDEVYHPNSMQLLMVNEVWRILLISLMPKYNYTMKQDHFPENPHACMQLHIENVQLQKFQMADL